jgi:thiol-disulfide isomerase/thioredoxin
MYSCATRSKLSFFSGAVLLFSFALASLSNMASAQGALDLHGKSIDPLRASHGKITVLIFARTDCPITDRYVPLLLQLRKAHAEKVNFWFVYPDKNTTSEQIGEHLRQFAISIPALRDPSHVLVKQASATITPEVAVFDAQARLLYHGRIDNLYEIAGRSRPAATTHELQDVLKAAIAGKPVPFATAPAVGCYISDLE